MEYRLRIKTCQNRNVNRAMHMIFVGQETLIRDVARAVQQILLPLERPPLFNSLPAMRGENGREAPREGNCKWLQFFCNRSRIAGWLVALSLLKRSA